MPADVIPLTRPHRCAACGSSDGEVQLVAVAEPNGSVREFYLHADCERAFVAGLPRGTRTRQPVLCAHCHQPGGVMARATFVGAPEGGIPVHEDCAVAWFKKMDAGGWEGL